MTLVQIDLRRPRSGAPSRHEHPAEPPARPPVSRDSLGPATAGLVLAGGLILLAPVAAAARTSTAALVVLLVGLAVLGMLAVLLRPAIAEVDRP